MGILNHFLRKTLKPYKGTIGEFSAHGTLLLLGERNIFRDLYIPTKEGKYSQVDLLVVTCNGIVVIENKNYSGWVFGNEQQEQWTQTFPNGSKYRFFNPIKQNQGHIYAISQFLQISEKNCFQSCILFSPQCELKNIPENSNNVTIIQNTNLKEYMDYVHRDLPICFEIDKLDDIIKQLRTCEKASKEVKDSHKERVSTIQKQAEAKMNQHKLDVYIMAYHQYKPELGAWSVIFKEGEKIWQIQSKVHSPTTINRNYLLGLIQALQQIDGSVRIKINSDNSYLLDNITRVSRWKENNWTLSDGKPVKNADLWAEILNLSRKHQLSMNVIQSDHYYGKRALSTAKGLVKGVPVKAIYPSAP